MWPYLNAYIYVCFYFIFRRKYEELLEKENRKNQLNSSVGHNHSRDSAIDTDMHEWETETLEFDIVRFLIIFQYHI